MPTFINMTDGHDVHIIRDSAVLRTFPYSGQTVRARMLVTPAKPIDGIPTSDMDVGEAVGLPEPQPDTYFIVSAMVLKAPNARGRADLLAPGESVVTKVPVLDEKGKPVLEADGTIKTKKVKLGCKQLVRNKN